MSNMTAKERLAREEEVRQLLKDGWTINQMAGHFGITQQSVQKFLRVRGWQTEEAKRRATRAEEKEKRIAERKVMPTDTVDRPRAGRHTG